MTPGNSDSSKGDGFILRRESPSVSLVEYDGALRGRLRDILLQRGWAVNDSSEQTAVLQQVSSAGLDLVIVGSHGSGSWDGLELARQIRALDSNVPIILVTEESSEELAIAALRAGVNDYIRNPFSMEELLSRVDCFSSRAQFRRPQQSATASTATIIDANRLVGTGVAIQELIAAIGKIAKTDSNVLITGETGTGKDLVAELIHKNSLRAQQPFVPINCAAIPDSLLESELFGYERGSFTGAYSASKGKLKVGDGGTIFLDEIGDMSPSAQSKILRVIESREVQRLGGKQNAALNVRFIAATNKDLEEAVAQKTFRKDLYYRLNVTSIYIPQLKDRKEDIPSLCKYFIDHFNRQFGRQVEGFTEGSAQNLFRYDWPGNIRELRNLLEATIGNFCGRKISNSDLPEQFRRRLQGVKPAPLDDRYPLLSVLDSTNWNISKAAQKLHWSRMTVYRKMAKYHINRRDGDKSM